MQHSDEREWDQVWIGAHVAAMTPGGAPYGTRADAAIAVKGERIAWIGAAAEARTRAAANRARVHEAAGQWILPGFIDCHTHLVYGGNRVAEYEARLNGATYAEIAASGGGIQSTVTATRAADSEELYTAASGRARALMVEGVTTIEIKSGYGLELATEARLLETARRIGRELPVTVRTTYLGLHALPAEYAHDRSAFVAAASGPWLAELHGRGLVDAVDAFCENIAFTVPETEQLLRAARVLGLGAHVHAGQLSDLGAAELAGHYGALSADHLEYLSPAGAGALAAAGTVAVLLPGAYYTLRQKHAPPVAVLRAAGVPLAVATDCNPGTSPCTSLLLMLNMACTLFGLTPEEAVTGATRHAARALGLNDRGTLAPGKRADFALWNIERPAELCYALGANPCAAVIVGGVARAGVNSG